MFTLLCEKDVSEVIGQHFLIALFEAVLIIVIFVILNHFFLKLNFTKSVMVMCASVYLNSNNIGLPVAKYILGDASLVVPVLLFQVILLQPICLYLIDLAKQKENIDPESRIRKRDQIKFIITMPLRSPIIFGVIFGLFATLANFEVPSFINEPINMISASAIPCVLISYGMSLVDVKFTKSNMNHNKLLGIISFLKLVGMPFCAFILCRFVFNITDFIPYVILAALPTAQNVFNFAVANNCETKIARDSILITTILAPFIIIAIFAISML